MPDLLAHVFLTYAVTKLLSTRVNWLTPKYVTVALAGAFVPDLIKIKLLLNGVEVRNLVEFPFSWRPLHTVGGVAVSILVGVVLVTDAERRRVATLLALGATTHLLADVLLLTPSGRTNAVLWPVTRYHPPTPGLYLSTDPLPTLVAGVMAVLVWVAVPAETN